MRTVTMITMMLLLITALGVSASAATWRILTTEVEVKAPVEKAWNAWTTPAGVKTFFAPDCYIEPRVDGAYDIFFTPDATPGERGAEDIRILSFEPLRRFAFTWNAPPRIPDIRRQRTMVILEFQPVDTGQTRVRFTQTGWGEGPSWDQAYEYFDHAWNQIVLPRFRYAMEVGPVDWKKVPDLKPVARTLKVILKES
jgi:uncharacterized protein YndB with AHSA1/START domain